MISKNLILMISFVFNTSLALADNRVRHVVVRGDQIVTVKTALGIATIIQVPDRPNSIVVGDQEAFKVEYLDQAVTIKPLQPGAKTNIYIYTDWKRYNVQLICGSESLVDYIVYLENEVKKGPNTEKAAPIDKIKWSDFKNSLRNDEITIETKRVAKLKNGILQIEFLVGSEKKISFSPEWIWLTQEGKSRPIHNLILSSLEINPRNKAQGILQILANDIDPEESFRIELRRMKVSFLTIKKVDLWK